MNNNEHALCWLRLDLRIDDNPALLSALKHKKVFIIYILDDINAKAHKMGEASRWWLHHALLDLNKQLNGQISFYTGDATTLLPKLCREHNITHVYWNRCYEPWRILRDTNIKNSLKKDKVITHSYNASLLWEPWEILKKDNTPYKVFTPFYKRGCLGALPPDKPLSAPKKVLLNKDSNSLSLSELKLLPSLSWADRFKTLWTPNAMGGKKKLTLFLENGFKHYHDGRNFPAEPFTSKLSPYLHFGQLSIRSVWHQIKALTQTKHTECFLSELAWREFSYYLLYHFPNIVNENFNSRFNTFPWIKNKKLLHCWQQGQTGIPIVDAGMRELWQTGYMHNRVRMICASFLVKNLLIDWREGEKWFWDCLLDADLASNIASWQWVAGSGADAAPYFRVFNPVLQAQKFDPNGQYILSYVPELKNLPKKYIANPFDAPKEILVKAGIKLGENYPLPIVDLKVSRQIALEAYNKIKR